MGRIYAKSLDSLNDLINKVRTQIENQQKKQSSFQSRKKPNCLSKQTARNRSAVRLQSKPKRQRCRIWATGQPLPNSSVLANLPLKSPPKICKGKNKGKTARQNTRKNPVVIETTGFLSVLCGRKRCSRRIIFRVVQNGITLSKGYASEAEFKRD